MSLSERENNVIIKWLGLVVALILVMVALGGFVRLTRSGLSIVEWNPISGVVPPIGQEAWEEEFAKYQQTPEFKTINSDMTLDGYKRIFYIEYIHRLVGRIAGLVVALPLLYFLLRGIIPWRKSAIYIAVVLLFAVQGAVGWYMVSSGLEDMPHVSHFRLTIHLLLALFLLVITQWLLLNHYYRFPARRTSANRSRPFQLLLITVIALLVQISYGGFVAGLKAGWIANTWPLMHGRLIPEDILLANMPWWLSLLEGAAAVHFIHRWFAFIVLLLAGLLYWQTKQKATLLFIALLVGQILLGISVVIFSVPIWLAMAHQFLAMLLFMTAVYIAYQLLYLPQQA